MPRTVGGFLYRIDDYEDISFPFSSFTDTECLILLGEPGIGKSCEIQKIAATETADDSAKLYINLNSIGSEMGLYKKLFESEKWQSCKQGNKPLYVYLDSLDEALLNINHVSGLLADEIADLFGKKFYLRIACRSGEWSKFTSVNDRLKSLWQGDRFQMIQLAALTAQDVLVAAKSEGIDGEALLNAISIKNAAPLAAKPVTLKLLMNLFKKEQGFPGNQFDLYERGCLTLAEENYATRPAASDRDQLSVEQRLLIAARIAALMTYSNKSSIWRGLDTGEQSDADMAVTHLAGFQETCADGTSFQITERNVTETLDTGLFNGDGSRRVRFGHQTFAEFLTAWYLENKKVSDKTVLKIIGEDHVHPQLYETSAWIANNRQTIFRRLIELSPLVLLRSDVFASDDAMRASLTSKLLDLFEQEEILDRDVRGEYGRLKNATLAQQLRPFIVDKTKGWLVRRAAIDIAESCDVTELQNELLQVALDVDDVHHTRVTAAYALKRIGEIDVIAKLKPLVWGTYDNDENLELKGVAMSALWKTEHLTTAEMFDAYLDGPLNFLGSYNSFLYTIADKMDRQDLPYALTWLKSKSGESEHLGHGAGRIAGEIMQAAWEHLDEPDVLDAFVAVVVPYVKAQSHGMIGRYGNELDSESSEFHLKKRQKVLVALLTHVNEKDDWLHLSFSSVFSFHPNDVAWVIEEWEGATESFLKQRLLDLVKGWIGSTQGYYGGASPDFLTKVFDAKERNEALRDELRIFFDAIELDSEEAKTSKEHYAKWLEVDRSLRRHEREEKDLVPSPKERMLTWLERFEAGETDGFWMLNREMTLHPKSTHYGDELLSDLRKLPGWIEADDALRQRIIAAARKYLFDGDPKTDEWIGTNAIQFSAFAGYRAIKLLINLDGGFVEGLPAEIWDKWTPIIYFYPIYNGSNQDEFQQHKELVAKAYHLSTIDFDLLVTKEIERATTLENSHISFDKFELCWDEPIVSIWREKLKDDGLSPTVQMQIFCELLEQKDSLTEQLAVDLIRRPVESLGNDRSLTCSVGGFLIRYGVLKAWPRIWEILNNHEDFGKEILENGVSRFGGTLLEKLDEAQLQQLYLWLAKHYPHSEDPDFSKESMAHFVGPREELGRWRDLTLDKLKSRGTKKAVEALQAIQRERLDLDWLKFTVIGARDRMHEKSWTPFPLPELRRLLKIDCTSSRSVDVLFLATNPNNQGQLELDEEARSIQNEISASEHVKLHSRWANRPQDLLTSLNEVKPQILHISGHGDANQIALKSNDGSTALVSNDALIKVLSTASSDLRVVVFNTCSSSQQALETTQYIDVAIGMNGSIDDKAARIFSAQFYSSIRFGSSVKNAFDQAIASMQLNNTSQEHIPQLFTKPGVQAESILFVES